MPLSHARSFLISATLIVATLPQAHATPLFPSPQFVTEAPPLRAVVADFNRDGYPDFAVSLNNSSVVAFAGRGDGSFGDALTIGPGGPAIALGDFNADGLVDLAAVDVFYINVFYGNGDGSFGAAQYIGPAIGMVDIAAGDLNGDERSDLLAAGAQNVRVLLSRTDGTFAVQVLFSTSGSKFVALGDFDHDGALDMALASYVSGSTTPAVVSMLPGRGDGTFASGAGFYGPGYMKSIAVGDLDGDGFDDLAADGLSSNIVVDLFFGQAPFGFSRGGPFGPSSGRLSIGDLNGDGRPDLLSNINGQLTVLSNSGMRSFASLPNQASCSDFNTMEDFNLDGRLDALLTGGDRTAYLGHGDGTFDIPRLDVGGMPYAVVAGDINGDGKVDLAAVSDAGGDHISILLGQGDGQFQPPLDEPAPNSPNALALCDFDGDGRKDIASTSATGFPGQFSLYFGNGDGTLQPKVDFDMPGSYPRGALSGDLNGDSRDDVVAVNFHSDDVAVFLGRADRVVGPPVRYPVGDRPRAASLGDIDEDGRLDLVAVNSLSGDASILKGRGDGTFSPEVRMAAGPSPEDMSLIDLDRDGHLDLVVANTGPDEIAAFFGRGDGTFEPRQVIGLASAKSIVAADFNGDSLTDLAVSGSASGHYVSVHLGSGGRAFLPAQRFAACSDPLSVAAADFDRDGDQDIVATTFQGLEVLVNQSPTLDDPDGDGVSSGNDNCPTVSNPGQADFDGDGAGDACDCAPADPGAFAPPTEVSGLTLNGDTLTWNSAAPVSGSGVVYDVVRGGLSSLPVGSGVETCLLQEQSVTTLTDATQPGLGQGFWYLVRGENACGVGLYGTSSDGSPEITFTCP